MSYGARSGNFFPVAFLNLNQSTYIHPVKAFCLSAVLFVLLLGMLYLPYLGASGENLENWYRLGDGEPERITLPFLLHTSKTDTVRFRTVTGPLAHKSLCLAGLDVNAMEVSLNGNFVFRAGDIDNATANLWNSMVAIPLPDSEARENEIILTLTGNFFISITRSPFLEDSSRAIVTASLHRILYHDFIILFMGAALLTGIFSIQSGFSGPKRNMGDILFGLACLVIIFYAQDYTFRLSTGPWPVYTILKRAVIASAFLGGALYVYSIDYHCNNRITLNRWFMVPFAVSIAAPFCIPGLSLLMDILPFLDIVLILQFVMITVMIIKTENYYPLYLIPTALIILSLIHVTFVLSFHPGSPLVLPYAIVLSVTLFGIQFSRERQDIARERDSLKNAYNRDPLTEAFNRHVLSELDVKGYHMAVFLDFDNFKYYNDKYGHDRGDDLLRNFVLMAKHYLRNEDLLIRFGGDEFLILFRNVAEEEAHGIMERIRIRFLEKFGEGRIDLSYGLSPVAGKGHLDIIELDEKMYSMKNSRKKG